MTRNAKSNYYKESLAHDFKNPKQIWNKIKTRINISDKTLPNQIRVSNVILHDTLLVTQSFNQHFTTVCSAIMPDPSIGDDFNNVLSSHSTFSFRRITPVNVQYK